VTCTVITGGLGGIGVGVAEELLAGDPEATCALVDIDTDAAADLASTFGDDRVFATRCDVRRADDVHRAAREVLAFRSDISGLVTAAGNAGEHPTVDVTMDEWHGILDVHLDGTLLWCQALAPVMCARGAGSIVAVSSVVANFGHPRRAAYAVAKAGVEELVRTIGVEWARWGVRVNAVAPGYVETDMFRYLQSIGTIDAELVAGAHALGRVAQVAEIAKPIVFLLSDAASFITATTLLVDGGFSALRTTALPASAPPVPAS
jgi:NAD(P)-dependent dehydrogenase (short-subunit alcohol dehydrogenase family)